MDPYVSFKPCVQGPNENSFSSSLLERQTFDVAVFSSAEDIKPLLLPPIWHRSVKTIFFAAAIDF